MALPPWVVQERRLLLGLALFAVAWVIIFICVLPVPWYTSRSEDQCSDGYMDGEVTLQKRLDITLWRYHHCEQKPLVCEVQCENKAWHEVWRAGCGSSGPNGEDLYCFNFDVSGEMTSSFLIFALSSSIFVFPLTIMRLLGVKPACVRESFTGKAALTLLAFCWACCIMSCVWYPYIANAKVWEEQTGKNLHLGFGWWLLLIDLVVLFASIVCYISDYANKSNQQYQSTIQEAPYDYGTTP